MLKFLTKKRHKGFTLIELLVVITIIGILAGIIIISVGDAIDRARLARAKSFARTIQTDLALDAVGMWRFDDDPQGGLPGGVMDGSAFGNHGTLYLGTEGNISPAAAWVPGVFGNALKFDGVDDFVEIGSVPELNFYGKRPFTIGVWIKPNCIERNSFLVSRWHGGIAGNYWVMQVQDRFRPGREYPPFGFVGDQRIKHGNWANVVFVYDGAEMRLYENGQKLTAAVGGGDVANHEISVLIGWARDEVIPNRHPPFKGVIDEVIMFNRPLHAFEIQDSFVKGIESLLARGLIDQEEFNNRMAEIEKNLVAK